MRKAIIVIAVVLFYFSGKAQEEEVNDPIALIKAKASNRVYGKLLDALTKKPVNSASVQLSLIRRDSFRITSDSIIRVKISQPNGDFEFNELPSADSFRLVISSVGYKLEESVISFASGGETLQKDLGNILLELEAKQMEGITITTQKPAMEMGIDRRIFSVESNITSTGGTALDVVKNIPSVSVDAEGNVQIRSSSPQIFVDGRPTILTLDQIPADNIERVEIITNPSAKFDASATGGILNIILKKNRKMGLNGIASFGGGYPDILNSSLTLNSRQGKLNFFLSGNYNQSGGIAEGTTMRTNKSQGIAENYFNQYSDNERMRKFGSFRAGFDYFIDNRNTLTLSHNFVDGRFSNDQYQDQEFFNSNMFLERYGNRISQSKVDFRRNTSQMNYTHRFPKQGRELTGNVTYNFGNGNNNSFIVNTFYNPDGSLYENPNVVRNESSNDGDQWTFQLDYSDPKGDDTKLEMGLRSYVNNQASVFNAFAVENGSETILPLSNSIAYREIVNAFYITYSGKIGNSFSYQAGLRAEHSMFDGKLLHAGSEFGYNYPKDLEGLPDALFPSLFLTKELNENTQMQLNYSRKIRRPSFWQLNPFFDINDPVNVSSGNPLLRPEYMNQFELNVDRKYKNGNILAVIYYRNNQDDITRFSDTITPQQYQQLNNAAIDPNAILNSFTNVQATNRLGAELIWQHKVGNNFDITPSIDLQYRKIISGIDHIDLNNEGFNYEAQLTANYRIQSEKSPFLNNFSFQLTGEYESPEVNPQGKNLEQYSFDLGIRKEFLKDKKAALTFNVSDIFWTDRWGSILDTESFYQNSYRRNVRTFRVTFSYKFGSADFQLFNKSEREEE